MLELVKFILSVFWAWLGFTVLAYTVFAGIVAIINACKRNRKVTAYRIGNRWHIQVENASKEDVMTAIYAPGNLTDGEGSGNNEEA